MAHPNNMTAWDQIACQRGPFHVHHPLEVQINLEASHGYTDCTPIPERLRCSAFSMLIWDPEEHPVDGGAYCPAHDAVSATIYEHKVWEPRETVLALDVFASKTPGVFLDLGAQLGWFTLLAASWERDVIAVEADNDNASMLQESLNGNGWDDLVEVHVKRIGRDPMPTDVNIAGFDVCLAKLDLEGAEREAIAELGPLIEEGRIANMLIEVSPVFDDYYPNLLAQLVASGFDAHRLPPKQRPPVVIEGVADLEPYRIEDVAEAVAGIEVQEDLWLTRR